MDLKELFNFFKLTHAFQDIKRVVYVGINKNDFENDTEHSYQLALVAWYIASRIRPELNQELLFKYALAHDLVEAYAGDTPVYEHNAEEKKEREHKAFQVLVADYPEFPDLHSIITQYELREDPESKFIYALDKLIPMINIYLDGGRSWQKNNASFSYLQNYKLPRVQEDPTVKALYDDLTKILEAEKEKMFPRS